MHFELNAEEIVGKVILKFQKISGKVRQSIVGKVILDSSENFGEELDKVPRKLWEKLY
jgi:hypothetical protein